MNKRLGVQSSRAQATSWPCLPGHPGSLPGGFGVSFSTREISNTPGRCSRSRQESIRGFQPPSPKSKPYTMRRIARIQTPTAALAQCLQAPASTPQHTAAATCLRRRRDFSTTPQAPFRASGRLAEESTPGDERLARAARELVQKEKRREAAMKKAEALAADAAQQQQEQQPQQPQQELEQPQQEQEQEPENQEAAEQLLESYDPDSADAGLPRVETDLVLPPEDVEVAQRADELEADGVRYEPADSAHGLEVVGGLGGWFERDEHWGASARRYAGFAPTHRVADPALLELNVRRAVAEALAVAAASAAAGGSSSGDKAPLLTGLWERGEREDAERALGLRLEVRGDGAVGVVAADAEGVVGALRWDPDAPASSAAAAGEEVGRQQFSPDEAREIVQTWDEGWKKISLHDAQLKFAVSNTTG